MPWLEPLCSRGLTWTEPQDWPNLHCTTGDCIRARVVALTRPPQQIVTHLPKISVIHSLQDRAAGQTTTTVAGATAVATPLLDAGMSPLDLEMCADLPLRKMRGPMAAVHFHRGHMVPEIHGHLTESLIVSHAICPVGQVALATLVGSGVQAVRRSAEWRIRQRVQQRVLGQILQQRRANANLPTNRQAWSRPPSALLRPLPQPRRLTVTGQSLWTRLTMLTRSALGCVRRRARRKRH